MMKSKVSKRVFDASARLAVFALSCHEQLVGHGDHIDQRPPQIDAMALALGVRVEELLGRGWDLVRSER